jgi:hypothetical protein
MPQAARAMSNVRRDPLLLTLDFGNINLLISPTKYLWLISLILLNALIVSRDEHLSGLVWLAVRLFSREDQV